MVYDVLEQQLILSLGVCQKDSASIRAPDANTTREPETAPTPRDGLPLIQIGAPVVSDSMVFWVEGNGAPAGSEAGE